MTNRTNLTFTSPVFSPYDGVLFSAYGVGKGYNAFTLSIEAACEKLGASDPQSHQVLLAFKLNHQRIARAIDAKVLPGKGQRVVLRPSDFA
ncbi:hypothetical protein BTHE68_63100 (plasmid) [Burkholderia sp. THE68]|uniref:hypothetical protein n=1 Tax=Burkholderia sp. THE68 TaxID=758782 RepID=UPI0013188A35|nr:hypothetical protein [Burkholderia sp. THE68]BBU32576.1 hypothetical protein BTHE68_63100 [Burkholderia sp. THE68]